MTTTVDTRKAQGASAKAINLALKSIVGRAATLQNDIHKMGMLILSHAEQFGDARPVKTAFDKLPKGQRREAFIEWITTYSPIRFNMTTGKVGLLGEDAKGFRPFDLKAANENPYYELQERPQFKAKPLDFATPIKASLTKAYIAQTLIDMNVGWTPDEGYDPQAEVERLTAACATLAIELPVVDTEKAHAKAVEYAANL